MTQQLRQVIHKDKKGDIMKSKSTHWCQSKASLDKEHKQESKRYGKALDRTVKGRSYTHKSELTQAFKGIERMSTQQWRRTSTPLQSNRGQINVRE